jgi:hypothetical protein
MLAGSAGSGPGPRQSHGGRVSPSTVSVARRSRQSFDRVGRTEVASVLRPCRSHGGRVSPRPCRSHGGRVSPRPCRSHGGRVSPSTVSVARRSRQSSTVSAAPGGSVFRRADCTSRRRPFRPCRPPVIWPCLPWPCHLLPPGRRFAGLRGLRPSSPRSLGLATFDLPRRRSSALGPPVMSSSGLARLRPSRLGPPVLRSSGLARLRPSRLGSSGLVVRRACRCSALPYARGPVVALRPCRSSSAPVDGTPQSLRSALSVPRTQSGRSEFDVVGSRLGAGLALWTSLWATQSA